MLVVIVNKINICQVFFGYSDIVLVNRQIVDVYFYLCIYCSLGVYMKNNQIILIYDNLFENML